MVTAGRQSVPWKAACLLIVRTGLLGFQNGIGSYRAGKKGFDDRTPIPILRNDPTAQALQPVLCLSDTIH